MLARVYGGMSPSSMARRISALRSGFPDGRHHHAADQRNFLECGMFRRRVIERDIENL